MSHTPGRQTGVTHVSHSRQSIVTRVSHSSTWLRDCWPLRKFIKCSIEKGSWNSSSRILLSKPGCCAVESARQHAIQGALGVVRCDQLRGNTRFRVHSV
eukprot:376643-Prorocentrum_minimum.AAC.1